MKNDRLIEKLNALIEPIVEAKDYELYYLEFVKEAGENYLRIYIDNENGISLEDCEKVSRAVSEMLDIEDPISESYYLEVSSPGVNRILYKDKHLNNAIGKKVSIKLSSLFEGKKQYEGILIEFNSDSIKINSENEEVIVPRVKILNMNLVVI